RGLGPLHRAVEAGDLAEEAIQGHGGERRPRHAHHQSRAQQGDLVLVLHGVTVSIVSGAPASGCAGAGSAGSARSSVARAALSAAWRAWLLACMRDMVTR